jgi:DNA-binding response OmpR family regulator
VRILIVEDDPLSSTILQDALEALGHEVVARGDGQEGWQAVQGEWFPVIISDMDMPHLDGLELCRRVRGVEDKGYAWFILLTSRADKVAYLEAMEAGVDDFLNKPADPDQLRARIGVATRILGLQREVRQLERLLPICSYCKKIKDREGAWSPIESYIARHTDSNFTHSICESCYTHVMEDLNRLGPSL